MGSLGKPVPSTDDAVRGIPRTLDLRPSANLFQLCWILTLSAIGVIVGLLLVREAPVWIGAAVGALFGMVIGALVSGFVLMLRPPEPPLISANESIGKYRSIQRQGRLLILFTFAWCSVGFAFCVAFGWQFIWVWVLIKFVCCLLNGYNSHQLAIWPCPDCGEPFGQLGVFEGYPHRCRSCGYTIEAD